jgi:histidine triad (HIT) family protein
MVISSEQINEIKKQLIVQIESTFPEDKKQESITKINSMNDEQLMNFLKENGMIKDPDSSSEQDAFEDQCVFCSIVSGQIPSAKIHENEKAIAILELNPLTEGHTLITPKNHIEKIPEEIKKFSEEVKEKIQNSLNPREILYEESNMFGHQIINLIPIYENTIPKERKKSSPEELKLIKEKIQNSSSLLQKEETPRKPETITEESIIPKRIP